MVLKKKINVVKKLGFRKTIIKAVVVALNFFISFRIVYKLDLCKFNKSKVENNYYNFFSISLSELRSLYSENKDEITKKRYSSLKKIIESPSSVCYIAKDGPGNICGYGCLALGREKHSKTFNRIKGLKIDKNGYFFRDYTFKNFRNIGVQKYLVKKRLELLKYKKYETATARIAIGNIASEKTYKRFGFNKELLEIHFHFFNFFPDSNFLLINISRNK